ncbi:blue copper oxidase cueO precursor [Pseudozyma hubeiensis SY62]|uniref:Blue copper oxidase cueO n=1 Tax=Pseudozyma hubeiensis (strain SY62) TaxID=1305764 RepID=R9PDA2_PSEHS|nr:blue copper oxidase cueO precursor [Pseudozyma hubeiensis SY62]GAC99329.1 blue copper oxidase cueO precursor [Pseudozyma hubeiensis SY62]
MRSSIRISPPLCPNAQMLDDELKLCHAAMPCSSISIPVHATEGGMVVVNDRVCPKPFLLTPRGGEARPAGSARDFVPQWCAVIKANRHTDSRAADGNIDSHSVGNSSDQNSDMRRIADQTSIDAVSEVMYRAGVHVSDGSEHGLFRARGYRTMISSEACETMRGRVRERDNRALPQSTMRDLRGREISRGARVTQARHRMRRLCRAKSADTDCCSALFGPSFPPDHRHRNPDFFNAALIADRLSQVQFNMVSLPRFLQASTTSHDAPDPCAPSIPNVATEIMSDESIPNGGPLGPLRPPGSLKTVFRTPLPRDLDADEFVDEVVPEHIQSSLLTSSASTGRRLRLDDSAGEGLRRNVLLRNAMLSSLERERRELSEATIEYSAVASSNVDALVTSDSGADEDEAQFFEDLLSELSGSDTSSSASALLETSTRPTTTDRPAEEGGQLEELDSSLPAAHLLPSLASALRLIVPIADSAAGSGRPDAVLSDSYSSAVSAAQTCDDSGFAESASRPASAASCCVGYPNVCPYPAVIDLAGGSSEELPALIDDNDSDLDEDEDADDDGELQLGPTPEAAAPITAGASGQEVSALSEGDLMAPISRSPVISPVHPVCGDHVGFYDLLSPETSRPTSPLSSASSKGDGEGPSPLLLPSDGGPLPSLAELSLQLPALSGTDVVAPPSRTLTGAWFEHKLDSADGTGARADRIRWSTYPSSCHRPPAPFASSSTTLEYQSFRLDHEVDCDGSPIVADHGPTDRSVVVHWSR